MIIFKSKFDIEDNGLKRILFFHNNVPLYGASSYQTDFSFSEALNYLWYAYQSRILRDYRDSIINEKYNQISSTRYVT